MRLEERENAHAELQEQLTQRAAQLAAAVEQLQEEFDRRESEWWAKQPGREPQAPAA